MGNIRQLLLIFLLATNISLFSQNELSENKKYDLTLISEVNQGNSYFTFGGGLGNIEPLIFEGNLIPNFVIRDNKEANLIGVITPQIIIRMYNKESLPVQTPSYLPHISLYYNFRNSSFLNNLTLFGKIAHHSNGQQDDFFTEDGDINLKSGNFSTNFLELGFITTSNLKGLNSIKFFSSSIEIHPERLSIDELKGKYSFYRWNNQFSIFKISDESSHSKSQKAKFSLKGQFTWLFGDINDWNFFNSKRIIANLTFYYHPTFLEEIGLFVQYYHGQDYYNIYFSNMKDIIRIGIMTDQFRF